MKKIDQKTAHIIDELFISLTAILPAFRHAWPTQVEYDEAKYQWTMAFIDSGLTDINKIRNGIKKFRLLKNPFVPTPGAFIELCETQPEDYNFLSKEQAYHRAYSIMRGESTHDLLDDQLNILNHAIKESNRFFLKNNSQFATQPVFYRNYEIAIKQFLAGNLAPIPKAIEDDAKTLRRHGGILPQYAHLNSRDKAIPVIMELLAKNGGHIIKKVNP